MVGGLAVPCHLTSEAAGMVPLGGTQDDCGPVYLSVDPYANEKVGVA